MPTWPSQLPKPTQNYSANAVGHLVTNEFEVTVRQRRKYSQREDVINVQWHMTQAQLDIFRYFVHNVIDGGALAFDTPIAGKNGLEVASVLILDGEFRVVYQPGPGEFTVTAQLLRQNPTLLSDAEYTAATT